MSKHRLISFIAIGVMLLTFLTGCESNATTQYVCPDGVKVSKQSDCLNHGVADNTATSTTSNSTATTTSSSSTLYGVDASLWTKQGENGWVLSSTSPETVSIADGFRIDYTDPNGNVYSCGDANAAGPGVYGSKDVKTDGHATVWEVPGETQCPSWTQYAKAHASGNASNTTPVAQTAPSATSSTASSWTSAQKCDWLRENFPQTTEDVQALGAKLAGVEPQRIRTGKYRCSATTTESVFDRFIVLGPNEGYQGTVTMTVPSHGAIDAYSTDCGARYTGSVSLIAGNNPKKCDDTYRASSGQVTALSVTYYPWNDADPPIGGSASNNSTTTPTATAANAQICETGAKLAADRGWIVLDSQPKSVTDFGGALVEVKTNDTLPDGWAAQTEGPELKGGDLMTPGYYSVYPPTGECRKQLGVQG